MRIAGHSHRCSELPASKLVLWETTHAWGKRRRPEGSFADSSKSDSGVEETSELAACIAWAILMSKGLEETDDMMMIL